MANRATEHGGRWFTLWLVFFSVVSLSDRSGGGGTAVRVVRGFVDGLSVVALAVGMFVLARERAQSRGDRSAEDSR